MSNKRQPNYTPDEIEVIVAGVEKNNKVSTDRLKTCKLPTLNE